MKFSSFVCKFVVMKLILIFTIFVFVLFDSLSQTDSFCKTDEMHYELFQNNKELQAGIINAHNKLEADTKQFTENHQSSRTNDPYIIPVVFHVIHNYGEENISDEQIYDAIEQVNIQLRKQNEDTVDIVGAFEPIAADTEIEIRLAKKDPNGNCTSGITRNVSTLTYIGDHEVKSIVQWPPENYLNIYVCSEAAGLAGHAMLPAAADTVPEWDGIVMQHSYVGTIGTSDYFRRTVLTHEIGHYLNLQHIWGGNNVPGYYYLPVANSNNCNHDDGVADTPNTIGWQTCNLSGSSCSSLDNVQNYMDYSYCARMFTEGQKQRMQACLNSSVANRDNLWSASNLSETGVDGNFTELCDINFNANSRVACVNEPVTFYDLSFHGLDYREWELIGSNQVISNDSLITVHYTEEGSYDVYLKVVKGNDTLELLKEDYIVIVESPGVQQGINENFEWEPSFDARFFIEESQTNYNWEIVNTGFKSDHSLFFNNYENPYFSSHSFVSKPIDVSSLSSFKIEFDVAYAMKSAQTKDELNIEVSIDCGETWVSRRKFDGFFLRSVTDYIEGEFIPQDSTEWVKREVNNIGGGDLTSNLMVRFRFTSEGGNNIFIDNILMGDPDVLNTENEASNIDLKLFPNPTKDEVNILIEGNNEIILKDIKLYDNTGRQLDFKFLDKNQTKIDLSSFSSGIYLIELITDQANIQRKVIKN